MHPNVHCSTIYKISLKPLYSLQTCIPVFLVFSLHRSWVQEESDYLTQVFLSPFIMYMTFANYVTSLNLTSRIVVIITPMTYAVWELNKITCVSKLLRTVLVHIHHQMLPIIKIILGSKIISIIITNINVIKTALLVYVSHFMTSSTLPSFILFLPRTG